MKFCWSTLSVKNLDESIAFYRDVVGLPLVRRFKAGPAMEIAFLGDAGTQIELTCSPAKQDIHVGQDISWGFETPSLEEKFAEVKAKGYTVLGEPMEPIPGVRFFFMLDPNGMKIQFAQSAPASK